MRSVGVVPTFETLQVLQQARARNSSDAIARRRLAKAVRDEEALRREAGEERRAKLRDGLAE